MLDQRFELPLNLTADERALWDANGKHVRDAKGDLQERISRHIDRFDFGISCGLAWEGEPRVIWFGEKRPPKEGAALARIVANWRQRWFSEAIRQQQLAKAAREKVEAARAELSTAIWPALKTGRTLAQHVIDAQVAVLALEGTEGAATRAELVLLIGELAAHAKISG